MTYEEILKLTEEGVEIWRPVVGYEGYYKISNFGRVKSVERFVNQGEYVRHVNERIKKSHIGAYGYTSITLCKDGKSRSIPIHRMLAAAFIPNPEEKTEIDHINTDKTDYSLKNIRWVTPKENSNNKLTLQHCREKTYSTESLKKRLNTRKAGNTITAPKTVYQYTKEGILVKEFFSLTEAERETGINHNSIHRALDDCTLSAGNYLWTTVIKEDIVFTKRQSPKSKVILQFDKDGNLIKEWSSILEAARRLGLHESNILRNIKSPSKPRKYKFKYKEDMLI